MTSPTLKDGTEKSEEKNDLNEIGPNLKGDWSNFFLLLLLYTIQGIPLGFSMALPIILQTKKSVSYKDQAFFSLVGWPFSMKLLWAPIVDAIYIQKLGRRKSWLVPVQFLIGICFVYMASSIDIWLPESETEKPNIRALVYVFFVTVILVATQDIVVDGWALTMLKKNNVGYASTCNATGQSIGVMIGSVVTVLLTSESFCNKYIRITSDTGGIVTMKSLFLVWGVFFMLVTILIAIFKKEKDNRLEENHIKLNIFENYSLLWDILKLPSIVMLSIALLTSRIGYAATVNISILKLIDEGVSKDDIVIIQTVMFIVNIFIPLTVGKYASGPKPLSMYLSVTPIRLFWNISFVLLIYYTPMLINFNGVINVSIYYYAILVFVIAVQDILICIMSTTSLAFFSRISDSRFGGTYMTLVNTITNLSGAWSSFVVLGMVDFLTFKECSSDATNHCNTLDQQKACATNGGNCVTTVDGYYVETVVCTILGVVWFFVFKNILKNLQNKSSSHWLVEVKKPTIEGDVKSA